MTTVRVPNCKHIYGRLVLADLPKGWAVLAFLIASWGLAVLIGFGFAGLTEWVAS